MTAFEPACLATSVGSLPLTDPRAACGLVARCFPDIPAWPQLPRLSFQENMYVQFSEGLPGVVLGHDTICVEPARVDRDLEQLYLAYLGDEVDTAGRISKGYAEGLSMMLSIPGPWAQARAVKGHVTGPISLGLQVTDASRRPILYDEILADAVAKLLRLKATWQETQLRRLNPQTIIFIDEPYLATFGSAYVPVSREMVLTGLEEVLEGIEGLKGLHCCGNTDWSMLLDMPLDIVSFDAYNYAVPFSLYAADIKNFLRRGGIIAWGIVPNEDDRLGPGGETIEGLTDRLLEAMDLLVQKGISRADLIERALITASCGLGTVLPGAAIRACEMVAGVSARMREMFGCR